MIVILLLRRIVAHDGFAWCFFRWLIGRMAAVVISIQLLTMVYPMAVGAV